MARREGNDGRGESQRHHPQSENCLVPLFSSPSQKKTPATLKIAGVISRPIDRRFGRTPSPRQIFISVTSLLRGFQPFFFTVRLYDNCHIRAMGFPFNRRLRADDFSEDISGRSFLL
jgi:hypothetical protein